MSMNGFGLLIGHLLGDYILQNDWMAANKTNSHPGKEPHPGKVWCRSVTDVHGYFIDDEPDSTELREQREWWIAVSKWRAGHLACTIHCLLYTLAVWACSFWWMPWWGLLTCFAVHWPVDRFRLARWWMVSVSGQKAFATGPLSPWSIIVMDNTLHLLTLFLIGVCAA